MPSKHTPGPWHAAGARYVYADAKSPVHAPIAEVLPRPSRSQDATDERSANARLIAAAPDLLAALRLAFDIMSEEYGALPSAAREWAALIARIEGV